MTLLNDVPLFAVVPAAGVGSRMDASRPKQYLTLDGEYLAQHTLQRLLAFTPFRKIVVALAADDPWWPELAVANHPDIVTVIGGTERASSVRNALQWVLEHGGENSWVMVHDMARPLLTLSDLQSLYDQVGEQGALLASPVVDTVKWQAADMVVEKTLDRHRVWRALTPQVFPARPLFNALQHDTCDITDEASAMEQQGWHPKLVPGRSDNIKITVAEDLALAAYYLQYQRQECPPL